MDDKHNVQVPPNRAKVGNGAATNLLRRIVQAASLVAIGVIVAVPSVVGGALVEIPPQFPRGLWGWLVYTAGAILLVLVALVTPYLPRLYRRINGKVIGALGGSPDGYQKPRPHLFGPVRWMVTAVVLGLLAWFAAVVELPMVTASPLPPGDLTIMSASDQSASVRQMLVEQWNQNHPHNHVDIITVDGSPDVQHDHLVNDVKEGGVHEADIYVLDVIWMPEFIENGYIKSLDPVKRLSDDKDFFPDVLKTCQDRSSNESILWCLPLNTDVGLLYYRSDLSGVQQPRSWDGYFGNGAKSVFNHAKVSDKAGRLAAANAAQFADQEILTITAFEAIWAAGGSLVDGDGKVQLSTDDSEVRLDTKTLAGIKSLCTARKDPRIVLPGNLDENQAADAFNGGRSLFMRNWPVAYDKLRRNGTPSIDFQVAPLPGSSVLGGQNLAISAQVDEHDPKFEVAHALIEYLASPESQLALFSVGGFAPTQRIVYDDYPGISRTYLAVIEEAVRNSRMRPLVPRYTEFSEVFRDGVLRACDNDGRVPDTFAKDLAKLVPSGS